MIISWITSKGASMGKLDDGLEQKLVDFCIQYSVKPLNDLELKQYTPIQFIPIKQESKNPQIIQPKKKWWKK